MRMMKLTPLWIPLTLLVCGAPSSSVSAQQIVCGNVRLPTAPNLPVVRDSTLKRVADSIPCIRTNGTPATSLRNRLALRSDSLSRRVPKTDTLVVVRTDTLIVIDTVFVLLPVDPLPPIELPPDSVPEVPPDPPTGEVWDSVLVGEFAADIVVPAGKRWLLKDVRVRGNVRCDASVLVIVPTKVAMRPGSSLTLVGADPNAYVGGGMMYAPEFARDLGVWASGSCAVDFRGTPKTPWNRTGVASDWSSSDELWVAPVAVGDFFPKRYTLGSPVPRADPLVPPAEVVNVTRDCVITGPGHIHIHTTVPFHVEFCALRNMGVSNQASKGSVLGRYALHCHMAGDASRGSTIRGVASVGARGKVFVPHACNGVTLTDNVAVNSFDSAIWWDFGDRTNDLMVEGLVVMGVEMPDSIGGGVSSVPGVMLPAGERMTMRNSAVSGVRGGTSTAVCFDWPEPTTVFHRDGDPKLVWDFSGNVAHNCRGPGLRFWTNLQDEHVVRDHASYRNAVAAAENGAYLSGTEYHGLQSFEDGYQYGGGVSDAAGFYNNASATVNTAGRVMQLTDCNFVVKDGPGLKAGHRQLPATHHFLIQDCTITPNGNPRAVGIPLDAWPKVWVSPGDNPWLAHLVRTNVLPEDIYFDNVPGNNGSEILIDHADGRRWRVTFTNGQKVVSIP